IKWGHLTIKLVRDSEKNPKHFICIIEDISKQKETQNALEKAKESAEAANLAKTQFLANMSHELRTPLNAILGFTQLMNRSAELTRKHQEYITTINRSGEHLLALINDILDLSKIESSQLELNGKNFDLYYLLDSLHKLFQPKAYKKNLELEIIIKENVPRYIKTDRLKLRSILINLLGNALKFTEEGGVKLSVKNKSNSSQISQLNLVFEVIDTGIGIASEEFDNLFQPFVQTQAGKTFTEGTGLGLAISKKFINLMGGNLNVISQLDVGTEFNFNILCEPGFIVNSTDSLPAFPVIKSMKNNESYRILLVEDLADNREVLRDYLEPIGFELKEASNGKEGIDIWKNWQPNLILMDIQMPVMNGYQAIQEIRLQESNNSVENTVKIIAVTASVFKQEQASIFEIGADDFIPKPIQEKELFTKIATHLSLSLVEENLEQAKSLQEIDPLDTKVIQGANILLVEDNPINQEVGQSLLENLGMIVTIANNGEEAINRIYDQQFDLVLMDISMPILDGLSATQRIREYPQFNNLPIIAMTAYGGTENYQSCKKVGMNDRLKKPINLEKLATLLKKWIDPKLSEQVSINLSKQNIPKISLNPKYNLQYLSSIDVEKAIKRVGEDLFLKLLMDFYEHYYQLPQSLRIDLQNNNYNEIQKVIHTIKTTASYIGANQLAKVSKNLEKVLEQQDRTSLNHAFLEFESELVKVLNNLKDFKNNVMNQLNQENKQAINNERKKISNILTLLESHIDEGNANAEDLVKELFQLITDQPVYPSLLELQRCVEELDSNNAKKILKKLQLKIS
ncbi:MAG: response regulator, partial [Crocosphaera sp.]